MKGNGSQRRTSIQKGKNVGVGKNRCEYNRLSFLKSCFMVEAKIINLTEVLNVYGGTFKTVKLKRWGG